MSENTERGRFGSARTATKGEIEHAGLFERACPPIGFFGNRPLYFPGDGHLATFAGSGAGKTRDFFGALLCDSPGQRMLICDPRGELAAISSLAHTIHGEHAPTWNPAGLCGLPNHGCNPLDIIDTASPTFHSDCQFIAEALVSLSGSANGQYFEVRARSWVCAFLKYLAEFNGAVSLPGLHRLISVIESDTPAWAAHLEKMLRSNFEAAYDNAHFERASAHRTAQARRLMTPEEVLAMEEKQLLFISGKGVPPILADRRAYYERSELAGKYLANPYHAGGEKRVQVATRWGTRRVEIITEEAPASIRSFPQHDHGRVSYLRGFKPRF